MPDCQRFSCKEVDEPVDLESEAVSGLPEVGEETVEEAPEELLEDAELVEEAEVVEVEAVFWECLIHFALCFCNIFVFFMVAKELLPQNIKMARNGTKRSVPNDTEKCSVSF